MKSPIEQYAEVEAMKKVDVLAVIDELISFEERHAEYEVRANYEARDMRSAIADLISACRQERLAVIQAFTDALAHGSSMVDMRDVQEAIDIKWKALERIA